MVKISWTPQARSDLLAIAEYIAQDSPKYAKIQIRRIRERIWQLRKFPNSGRQVPEYLREDIRELILGNYRIVYKLISSGHISILTVHHSAKRLKL